MESFFLSETVKYLYLLFSNATALVDHFVLSTEARHGCSRRALVCLPWGVSRFCFVGFAGSCWQAP
jgi:hypothetical protein